MRCSAEAVYEPVHLGVAWTSPVDVEERMMLTRRGIKLVWAQVDTSLTLSLSRSLARSLAVVLEPCPLGPRPARS